MRTITRRFKFDFAHHLPGYLGKCVRMHGHTAVLEIELEDSPVLRDGMEHYNGMILDFRLFERRISPLMETIDHRCLNDLMEIPTAENLLDHLVIELKRIFGAAVYRVVVHESETACVTWIRGER
jgi:6-pyruvoyltetrahydropterin/6-carboxytetrahydropterin synthase